MTFASILIYIAIKMRAPENLPSTVRTSTGNDGYPKMNYSIYHVQIWPAAATRIPHDEIQCSTD